MGHGTPIWGYPHVDSPRNRCTSTLGILYLGILLHEKSAANGIHSIEVCCIGDPIYIHVHKCSYMRIPLYKRTLIYAVPLYRSSLLYRDPYIEAPFRTLWNQLLTLWNPLECLSHAQPSWTTLWNPCKGNIITVPLYGIRKYIGFSREMLWGYC